MKKLTSIIAIVSLVLLPVTPARAATYTVTNNNDSGLGSLRAAITDANSATGTHTVAFAGSIGTIQLLSALPSITFTPTFDLSGATGAVTLSGNTMGFDEPLVFNGGGTFVLGTSAGMPGGVNDLTVGNTGTAALSITNGATVSNAQGRIGYAAGGNGTVTVEGAGSAWTNSGNLIVGYAGTGTLNIQNGGEVSSTKGYISCSEEIGCLSGESGTVTVDGAGSKWTMSDYLEVGDSSTGTGTLIIQNGGEVSSTSGYIGYYENGNGMVTVDGVGSKWTMSDYLGVSDFGTGTLTIQNGGEVSSIYGSIGSRASGNGTLTVDGAGSKWTISDSLLDVGAQGTGTMTVKNNGMVSVGGGAGTVTLGNAASIGTLNIGAGGAAGTLESAEVTGGLGTATVDFNHNESEYTFAPLLSGSLSVKQTGPGTTILTGANTYTGTTTLSAGKLTVGSANACGTSSVTVANGGTLDVGTYGLDIGGGTYEQEAGSRLQLAVDSSTSYGRILSTAAATVDDASAVAVTVGGEYIAGGTTFTVVNGAASAAVEVPGAITSSSNRVSFMGSVVNGDLILTAVRSGSYDQTAGTSSNGQAAGAALESAGASGATGDMLTVLNTLDTLSDSQLKTALETMVPDVSSGAAEASRGATSQAFTMISNRLGGARSGFVGTGISAGEMLNGVGVWMQGLGSHMKQGERKGIEGYQANLFGTTIGADKLIDRHFRMGLAGSYGFSDVNSKTPGSPSDDIHSYQATFYGSFDSLDLCEARKEGKNSRVAVRNQGEDLWYVDGMTAFTEHDYDSRREIWLTPTTHRVAKADHAAQQYSTNFEAGYTFTFEKTKSLGFTPFASIGYNYLYMNKYKEKGADALNLTVQGEGFHQLEQGLGTRLSYPIVAKKAGTFIPSAKAVWLYDYIGDRFETTSNFAGGGPSFNTQGAKPAKNGMLFGAELAFLNKGNMTVTGNWDIELKDQFMSNTYYGTVRYDF